MQVGLGEKTTTATATATRPTASKVHPWALRLIVGWGAGHTGPGLTVLRLLSAQGMDLLRLPTGLTEPVT